MWIYNGLEVTDEMVASQTNFVYVITRTDTGRFYIGKKRLIKKTTRAPLKGKKRKRVSYTSSDWKTYFGSNEELQQEVAELGEGLFKREILFFTNGLGIASYVEALYQFQTKAIVTEKSYNLWMSLKVRGSHLKAIDLESIHRGATRLREIVGEDFV